MKKAPLAIAATMFMILGVSPAQAVHTHYGESARRVATEIGCKNFTGHGGGRFNLDGGVCWVKGKRVNVITFRGLGQQGDWNAVARVGFGPGFWWGNGKGAVVVAKNGNKPAARIGANRLPGNLVHG
jgi:hypothetical protein